MKVVAVAVALVLLASAAVADVLVLKDGRRFEGNLVSSGGGVVKFKTAGGVLEFPEKDVESIEKGATKADEFAARRKAIANDDYRGLLDLARWCADQKLVAQRNKLLAEIVKAVPNHPEARREMGQVHRDGKWVAAGGPATVAKPEPGEKVEIPETPMSVAFPKGWTLVKGPGRAVGSGPAVYAAAPVLTVAFGPAAEPAADPFPEKDGWAKPAEVSAAGLGGSSSTRDVVRDHIAFREWRAVLAGPRGALEVGLVCLVMEADVFAPAFDLALRTAALAAPKADYVNTTYKYQCDLPQPADEYEWAEDEEHDLFAYRKNQDATGYVKLAVVAGNAGEEADQVRGRFAAKAELLKTMGDVKRDEEIALAGEKARLVEGTYLDDGIPSLMRVVLVTHGGRAYCLEFDRHEHGKYDDVWDRFLGSFRFTE